MRRFILPAGLILAYFLTRLPNLGVLPIFTDEAIYLRWSQIMAYDAGLRYLPLVDGKPPLFMWLTSIMMRLLPHIDIMLTGRLVSVFAGLGSMIGIYFASYQLFKNKTVSYLAAICYLLTPFTFFYDRFSTADSLLAMIGIWCLGLGVLLVQSGRLDVALILGMLLGFGRLTKTPALFFLLLLPFYLLLRDRKHSLFKILGLMALIAGLSEMFYSILRLFPLFNMIASKNAEFVGQSFEHLSNFPTLLSWELWYLTVPVSIMVLVGFFGGLKKHFWPTIILAGGFLMHLTYMSIFNKVIYPRFLLTFTPYLFILAALGLSFIRWKLVRIAVFVYPIFVMTQLIISPVSAPLLQGDRDQYLDGWPAGNGVKEVRFYLSQLPGHNVIATEGTFGLMPYALELYQKDYPNLDIKPLWPLPEKPAVKYDYLLMYQNQNTPTGWKLQELMRFRQGRGTDYLRLYKVL